MKKIVITYGLIAGVILGAMFFVTAPLYDQGIVNFDNGMIIGYTTMVVALSLVFFGVKSYRDNQGNGAITFGKGFQVGILITLLASFCYALSWEVAYNTVSKGYSEKFTTHYIEKVKAEGKPEAEVNAAIKEMEELKAIYENPFIRFAMTLMEILPVGLIITLISAALLRKNEFLPTAGR